MSRVRLQCKLLTATNAIGIWMSERDDVADTLKTEGSHYAIQEGALVDQTFLQQRKRQRDVQNKQLRAPVFVSDPMTTQVSSETQAMSPTFSPLEGETHTPITSSVDHDTCTSSVQAYSAIFTPNQAQFVVLLRLQISGMHKNTISHCRTGLLVTVIRLLDSNQT